MVIVLLLILCLGRFVELEIWLMNILINFGIFLCWWESGGMEIGIMFSWWYKFFWSLLVLIVDCRFLLEDEMICILIWIGCLFFFCLKCCLIKMWRILFWVFMGMLMILLMYSVLLWVCLNSLILCGCLVVVLILNNFCLKCFGVIDVVLIVINRLFVWFEFLWIVLVISFLFDFEGFVIKIWLLVGEMWLIYCWSCVIVVDEFINCWLLFRRFFSLEFFWCNFEILIVCFIVRMRLFVLKGFLMKLCVFIFIVEIVVLILLWLLIMIIGRDLWFVLSLFKILSLFEWFFCS